MAVTDVHAKTPRATPRHTLSRLVFWPRLGFILLLTIVAYLPIFLDVVENAADGSRNAYLVVVPALAAIVAHRYQSEPRGVGDAETDWIAAILVATAGFIVIWLVTDRLPTTSNMWKLHLAAVVVWVACSTSVMFGARYASRMVALWLFLFVSVTPLPYLLVTARFGGSDTAAAILAAALGATAVFLSGRATVLKWRLGVTVACLVIGSAAAMALRDTTLLLTVVVVAGLIPVLSVIALYHFSMTVVRQRHVHVTVRYARRSWVSYTALGVIALTLLFANASRVDFSKPIVFRADWIQRSGLTASTDFGFITRFLGPSATLTRYPLDSEAGLPEAAIDVISTPNTGALRDYADAIWYPTTVPVIFAATELVGRVHVKVRVMHANADATTDGDDRDWYALTWLWRGPEVTQQVTVVINQARLDRQPPPEPRPMSFRNQMIEPLLWIPRQQWDSVGVVDELVVRRAENIAQTLLSAGNATDG
ncbi:MAG: hypothetical protein ABW001_04010 [Mycobacterium sp.]